MRQGADGADASIAALEREIESRHRSIEKILGRNEQGAPVQGLTDVMGIVGNELAYGSTRRMGSMPLAVLAAGTALWAREKVSSTRPSASDEAAGYAGESGPVSHAQHFLKRHPLMVAAGAVALGALVGSMTLAAVADKRSDNE